MHTRQTTAQETFALMGARATVLADAAFTGGAWEGFALDLTPGARSPLHTLTADKLFVVATGEVTIVVGENTLATQAGESVQVPAGTAHCYRNDSPEPARLLVTVSGTGQLDFLRGMSRLTAGGPPAPDAVAAHAAEHGVTLLPPRG